VKDKDGVIWAVKVIYKEKFEDDGYSNEYVMTEINAMINIQSDYVVKLKEYYEDEE
jgi:hypothetical protein